MLTAPAVASGRRSRILGVLAHVDAGKTTLTEQLLFLGGRIAAVGSVDRGTSASDRMPVERRRGISVRASTLSLMWRDTCLNLIDTPGHADFAAEVERSLRVLDAAILVVCAAQGVQAQTETLWRALRALRLPTLVFVNKIDRVGASSAAVLAALRRELSPAMIPLNAARDEGSESAFATPLGDRAWNELVEAAAAQDDALLERYLANEVIEASALSVSLRRAVAAGSLFPVLCGSAKTGAGMPALLDAIVDLLPAAGGDAAAPLSAVVFRLDHDPRLGRVAGVRLYAGRLRNRDRITNATAGREEQVTQIKRLGVDRYEDAAELGAGDIGYVCGLPQVRIGDVLGDPTPVPGGYSLAQPVLSVQVEPVEESERAALIAALQTLASEDPHLDCRLDPAEREIHLRIMGAIQTEILTEVLQVRFGLSARFAPPAVIYRETPAALGYGEESYTMPKPCWAIVRFRLEPGPRGSGVAYTSEVALADIQAKYQNEIRSNLADALRQGVLGWEVTDVRVTLVGGNHHLLHSRPGDFKLASNMAILKGLVQTGTVLLEPVLEYAITGPREHVGRVTAEITRLRGAADPGTISGEHFALRARVPLATSMDLPTRLSALTRGRAAMASRLWGYQECPTEWGVVRPYRGVSPLDRARYILWWRGALTDPLANRG